ncbi:MAG TPA: glycoside hydrolase family 2 TIM barrel-domain containing protein [Candidatus Sulfotelmatobacter sp.]|nr:glycoside hydrolase family 2 TIM barrel-domain containing protein [Candidatus Sulfotelmatobacter sp.]
MLTALALLTNSAPANDDLSYPAVPIIRLTPVPAQVRNVKAPTLDLDGTWMFNPHPPANFPAQPIRAPLEPPSGNSPGSGHWSAIQVPGEWVMQGFTVPTNTHAAYERSFTIPRDWAGGRVKLRCNGVYSDAIVFVNGRFAGRHLGGFTPFELDITRLARFGARNIILVGVQNDSIADDLASGSGYAAHELGGISRDIYLVNVPDISVSDIYSQTRFDDAFVNATLITQICVANDSGKSVAGETLALSLMAPAGVSDNGQPVAVTNVALPRIRAGEIFTKEVRLPVASPLKWDPEHPNLYALRCGLGRGRDTAETVEQCVGFRQVDVRGNQLFVNNMPVKLRGVCRHETYPLLGRATTQALVDQDVKLFREMNVNSVRTSHYPPTKELVQDCDSMGLFVEEEAPFCWVDRHNSTNAATRAYILQAEMETILRDRSDPAVILWSMGNESSWGRNFALARSILTNLDSSRPYGFEGSSGEPVPPPDFDTVHYPGLVGPADYAHHSRPILFGEYGHLNCYNRRQLMTDPGLREYWGDAENEMWRRMRASQGCLGGNIWAGIDDMFDLPSGQVVGYGSWGPLDGWRRPKPEFWQLKNIYCPLTISGGDIPLPGAGQPISIGVENHSLFSDLKEFYFTWTLDGHTGHGTASAAAPGDAGSLVISIPKAYPAGSKLLLKGFDPRGVEINTWEFTLGAAAPAPEKMLADGKLSLVRSPDFLIVKGAGFQWKLDARTGMIREGTQGHRPILVGGPDLMLLPLISDPGDPDNLQLGSGPYVPCTESCAGWTAASVTVRETNETIEVTVDGTYGEAKGQYNMCFDGTGQLKVSYNFTLLHPMDPWQIGLVFNLPRSCDTLSWHRKALWSWYPEDDIGRPIGTAKALTGRPVVDYTGPHSQPSWPWSQDDTAIGSNDFRSTKRNILRASLADASGAGVTVISDGSQSARCWLDGDRVRLLVADYINNGSGEFVEHLAAPRHLKTGSTVRGSITLRLQTDAVP